MDVIQKQRLSRKEICFAFVMGFLTLFYALYLFSRCNSRTFLVIGLLIALLVLVVCAIVAKKISNEQVVSAYVLSAATIGLLFCFVFPPLSVPDEMYHYQSAYWYSDFISGSASPLDSSTFPMREDDYYLLQRHAAGQVANETYKDIASSFSFGETDDSIQNIEGKSFDLGANPPQLKLAPAIALLLGKALGLGAYPVFYLGRIFNLFYFILLSAFAIKISPIGKKTIAMVCLLPITLHLAASYSYDAGILGLAFLFTAAILRAIKQEGMIGRREAATIFVVGILLAPCKVIYSLLALLVFFIPSRRFSSSSRALQFKIGLLVCMFAAVIVLRITTLATMVGAAGMTSDLSRDGQSGQAFTVALILSNPISSLMMFVRTVFEMGDFYWFSMIGGTLGLFQGSISAPHYFAVVYIVLLLAAMQRSRDDGEVLDFRLRLCGIAVCLLGFAAVIVSLWVGWTFTTDSVVQGVQGRYFLPLLPLLLLSLRPAFVYLDKDMFSPVLKGLFTMNCIYCLYILANGLITHL